MVTQNPVFFYTPFCHPSHHFFTQTQKLFSQPPTRTPARNAPNNLSSPSRTFRFHLPNSPFSAFSTPVENPASAYSSRDIYQRRFLKFLNFPLPSPQFLGSIQTIFRQINLKNVSKRRTARPKLLQTPLILAFWRI